MTARLFRLSEVTDRIEAYLRPRERSPFWVKAEIGAGRVSNGSFFGELVETLDDDVVASLQLRIWSDDLDRIRKRFAQEGLELQLAEGAVVGIECALQYHPRHGLSLRGLDIDPSVSLGELELKRRRILDRLQADGLLERNRALPVARLPLRIALVTSRDSAACQDFVETLQRSGFGFRTYLVDTAVQGVDTEPLLLRALRRALALPIDLVAVVRGGGSRLDLGWLDSEAAARAIAAAPLPVWTGIGHETDSGVLDAVAGRAFKTPTAVAEELVARARAVATVIDAATLRLARTWRQRTATEVGSLSEARNGLRQGSRKLLQLIQAQLHQRAHAVDAQVRSRLGRARTALGASQQELHTRPRLGLRAERRRLADATGALGRGCARSLATVREVLDRTGGELRPRRVLERLERERRTLDAHGARLREADPRTALGRGYAILRSSDGALVRSIRQVEVGDDVTGELADGELRLDVTDRKEPSDAQIPRE